jgi:hypothetical protein
MEPYRFHRVHKNPALDNILSQLTAVYTLTYYFFKIYFNIIVTFTRNFPKWSSPFRFLDCNLVIILTDINKYETIGMYKLSCRDCNKVYRKWDRLDRQTLNS